MAPKLSQEGKQSVTLSRWQLNLYSECKHCFWLVNHCSIKQPKSLPFALNSAIDGLLKVEFDAHRAAGTLPPILSPLEGKAKLFTDTEKLQTWRNNFRGVRWTDPASGHTLFGAVDDVLQFNDGSLAVIDYKSTGSAQPTIYDSYQLQMDVYTYLLKQLGFRTALKSYFAFFLVVKDDGFNGRLPFREQLVEVTPTPERVAAIWSGAAALALSDSPPASGETCDLCRWYGEAAKSVL